MKVTVWIEEMCYTEIPMDIDSDMDEQSIKDMMYEQVLKKVIWGYDIVEDE